MEKGKNDTYTGFCLGFVTSLAMCGFYWLIMIHEQQVMLPMVEVYPKYSVPEPKGLYSEQNLFTHSFKLNSPYFMKTEYKQCFLRK